MTEQEAIKVLKRLVLCGICTTGPCEDCERKQAKDVALQALEEIRKYREIGTVEEIRRMQKYATLAKKHGTIGQAIDSCAEYEGDWNRGGMPGGDGEAAARESSCRCRFHYRL